ncbi:MAG: GntR family transcriptional regulator [Chloracidobacterium sp.]|nr:GntR family transcriptional regulator [Chloracidobacterium sp.]
MKIWVKKNGEISLREQIVTQIKIGIAGGDLTPGQKLPSTRELSRRLSIHPNTAAAAYRQLTREQALEFKPGSGFYVTSVPGDQPDDGSIEGLLDGFVELARKRGFTIDEIRSALARRSRSAPASRFAVFEDDPDLCEIILREVSQLTDSPVVSVTRAELAAGQVKPGTVIAALSDERHKLERLNMAGHPVVYLSVNSVPKRLGDSERPDADALVAVISAWGQFLEFSRIYLLAAGVDAESLIVRDRRKSGWAAGLESASMIICDSVTADHFAGDDRVRVFSLLHSDSNHALTAAAKL